MCFYFKPQLLNLKFRIFFFQVQPDLDQSGIGQEPEQEHTHLPAALKTNNLNTYRQQPAARS